MPRRTAEEQVADGEKVKPSEGAASPASRKDASIRHAEVATPSDSQVDKRCLKTKREIRNALALLMTKEDISQISVTELANAADISRKTFYAHYDSVYAVLSEIEDDLVSMLKSYIAKLDFANTRYNPTELFRGLTDLINGNPNFYSYLLNVSASSSLIEKVKVIMKETLRSTLSSKVNASEEDLTIAVEFIAGGTLSVYQNWLASDRSIPLDQAAYTVSRIAFDGMNRFLDSLVPGSTCVAARMIC